MIEWRNISVRTPVLVTAACLVLVGILFIFLTSHATRDYRTRNLGLSAEARQNPFLALQMFVTDSGTPAETVSDFTLLDKSLDPNDTLFIDSSRKPLSQTRIDRITQFVEAGGHLILHAVDVYDPESETSQGPFMERFDLRLYQSSSLLDDINYEAYLEAEDESRDELANRAKFQFENYEAITEVDFGNNYYLLDMSDEASFSGGTEDRIHLVQYHLGEGLITVLSGTSIWRTYEIDNYDHAMFFYQLVGTSNRVWIIFNPQVDSLISLLWKNASATVISFALLVIATIWFFQIKTMPVFAQFSLVRRQLIQHIDASASFKERFISTAPLLAQAREQLTIYISMRHSKFKNMTPDAKVELLHHWTDLTRNQLHKALFESSENATDFTDKIATLQQALQKIQRKVI